MDRVACIDDETFVTGSDNGSIALWNIFKKKPVFTYPLAHGMDPPLPLEQLSAEEYPEEGVRGDPQPRWITALRAIPFSDLIVTGSWDGCVRVWKISQDKRRIEALGPIGSVGEGDIVARLEHVGVSTEGLSEDVREVLQSGEGMTKAIVGVVNDLAIVDRGERGKDGVLVAAAVGKEHRLGRWGGVPDGKSQLVLFEVKRASPVTDEPAALTNGVHEDGEGDDFAGFD